MGHGVYLLVLLLPDLDMVWQVLPSVCGFAVNSDTVPAYALEERLGLDLGGRYPGSRCWSIYHGIDSASGRGRSALWHLTDSAYHQESEGAPCWIV